MTTSTLVRGLCLGLLLAGLGIHDSRGQVATGVCRSDGDCSNGKFCDGAERCAPGDPHANRFGCVASSNPCQGNLICDEVQDRCNTGPVDADHDLHASVATGGDDCDDADPNRFPGNTELCDAQGHDEDCDYSTYGHRDRDDDGYDDAECMNVETR